MKISKILPAAMAFSALATTAFAQSKPGFGVPDSGSTIGLVALGLIGLVAVPRFFRK